MESTLIRWGRIAGLLVAFYPALLLAQMRSLHVSWTASFEPTDVRAGESARILVRAEIAEGWHIYALDAEGPVPTSIELMEGSALEANGELVWPKPAMKYDEGFERELGVYTRLAVFALPVKVKEGAVGSQKAKVVVRSQACDANGCDPPATDALEVNFEVRPGPARSDRLAALTALPEQPQQQDPGTKAAARGSTDAGPKDPFSEDVQRARQSGLWAFAVLSFVGGLLALLTPCVFPMIPITVSFFSKKSGDTRKTNYGGALAYCLGIVSTFTALGLAVTVIVGPTGIQDLATNPWVNILVFVIFVALALSLFGLYEISVPPALLNRLGGKASRVGFVGPIVMGLVFSLTTFTCTVPIVGALLVVATAGGDLMFPIVGMVAFATAFSLPFFFLALFPDFLSRLPKSGAWMGQVKVFMGFVELAAAVKFLSNVDLVWQLGWLTQPVFLALWASLAFIAGFQLLGFLRLGNEPVGVPIGWMRRGFGLATLGLAVYCLAGIQGAPLGELAAFLPPEPYPGKATAATGQIAWRHSFEAALSESKSQGKPMFINFTGVTCTNCRWMEKNMFPRQEVSKLLANYISVELFTDRGTPEDLTNRELQKKLSGGVTLPVYVLMTPDESVLKVFQGSTRDEEAFKAFLRQGIERLARK